MLAVVTPMQLSHHSSNPMEEFRNDAYESDDPLASYSVPVGQPRARLNQLKSRMVQQQPVQDDDDELEIVDDEEDELLLGGEGMDTTGDELYDDTTMRPDDTLQPDDDDDDDDDEDSEDAPPALDDDDEPSTDEEASIMLREPDDRAEIEHEFEELLSAVPRIANDYALLDRLGTGTFSSVYKARDLRQSAYDNSLWLRDGVRGEYVAIKRIYVTSSPERVSNEICILYEVAGCRHVAQLITAFRERDQVVAVMPYHRNADFRCFFHTLAIDGVQAYFRCLFRALRDIHARGIVHRDVKPANFLFDTRTYEGVLVDFGLAMHVSSQSPNGCNHSSPTPDEPHGRFVDLEDGWSHTLRNARRDARLRKTWQADRVGYPADDHRPVSKANRAGTRGFRAPEVLLKCDDQSGAIDVWAAGTILLFFLTGRFPLYNASDDVEALMELASIIGYKSMERVAILHNRTFITNVPSITDEGMTWRDFVLRMNPVLLDEAADDHAAMKDTLEDALDFVERCLEPAAPQRMTARDALYHPFLQIVEVEHDENGVAYTVIEDDDEACVHPPGEGVCAALHRRDEVTGEWCVIVPAQETEKERVVQLAVGEGLCTGSAACEFHRHLQWDEARAQADT